MLGARDESLAGDLYGKVILRNAISMVQEAYDLKTYVRVEAAKEALDLARIEQRHEQ